MKKFLNFIRSAPKRATILFVLGLALLVPAAINAWGPSRPTFTIENPAGHVTFNSITNNPVYGDERNFAFIREVGTSTWMRNIKLEPGKTYEVFAYYHNNANPNLNASGQGVATGAFMRVEFPSVVNESAVGNIFIGAANANPRQVWDTLRFTSNGQVAVRYVSGSATITTFRGGVVANGQHTQQLSDNLLSPNGTLIGEGLDGVVRGCNNYSGFVMFRIAVDQPNFEVTKQVRLAGTTTWHNSITAEPGDIVEYMITYKNTGTTVQNNVVIVDELPNGITYIEGSTRLINSNNPDGKSVADGVTTTGINIGSYAPGAMARVTFQARVVSEGYLQCGTNTLTNTGRANTNNGSKDDTANVVVERECDEEEPYIPEKPTPNDPSTPDRLPTAGPGETISAVMGLGALATSARYYVASRRRIV